MKRLAILITALTGSLSTSYLAASVPNHQDPIRFIGPTLRGSYTDALRVDSAYSLVAEAGWKNFRMDGTVGWRIANNQRLKFSGDYLVQNISYSFFAGNNNRWMSQALIAAGYQYDFAGYTYSPQFNLSAYVAHGQSHPLATSTGTFTNKNGLPQNYTDYRRVAAANAGGIAPGLAFQPWLGMLAMFDLNYDNVHYDKIYSPDKNVIGVGGTITLRQVFTSSVSMGALAAVRRPFNNYQADLTWHHVPYLGIWNISAFGGYTAGKATMPNTYNVGISFDLLIDCSFNCISFDKQNMQSQLNHWVAKPAVTLPQVLAIPDDGNVSTLAASGL